MNVKWAFIVVVAAPSWGQKFRVVFRFSSFIQEKGEANNYHYLAPFEPDDPVVRFALARTLLLISRE